MPAPKSSKNVIPAEDYEKLTPTQKAERKLAQNRDFKKRKRAENKDFVKDENKKRRVGNDGAMTTKQVEARKQRERKLYEQKAKFFDQINEQLVKIDYNFFKNCLKAMKPFEIKPWNHECFSNYTREHKYDGENPFYIKREKAIKKSLTALQDLLHILTEFNKHTEKTAAILCYKFTTLSTKDYPKGGAAVAVKRKITNARSSPIPQDKYNSDIETDYESDTGNVVAKRKMTKVQSHSIVKIEPKKSETDRIIDDFLTWCEENNIDINGQDYNFIKENLKRFIEENSIEITEEAVYTKEEKQIIEDEVPLGTIYSKAKSISKTFSFLAAENGFYIT